jgi:hypothetical protein
MQKVSKNWLERKRKNHTTYECLQKWINSLRLKIDFSWRERETKKTNHFPKNVVEKEEKIKKNLPHKEKNNKTKYQKMSLKSDLSFFVSYIFPMLIFGLGSVGNMLGIRVLLNKELNNNITWDNKYKQQQQ